jgi:hypothetical protein
MFGPVLILTHLCLSDALQYKNKDLPVPPLAVQPPVLSQAVAPVRAFRVPFINDLSWVAPLIADKDVGAAEAQFDAAAVRNGQYDPRGQEHVQASRENGHMAWELERERRQAVKEHVQDMQAHPENTYKDLGELQSGAINQNSDFWNQAWSTRIKAMKGSGVWIPTLWPCQSAVPLPAPCR